MFTPDFDFDLSMTTTSANYGIDKLSIMIEFMELLPPREENDDAPLRTDSEIEAANQKFISWLQDQIKRKMNDQELIRFYEAVLAFIRSDLGTPERLQAMNTIFELEFLDKPTAQ